jgi:hypothetical protein
LKSVSFRSVTICSTNPISWIQFRLTTIWNLNVHNRTWKRRWWLQIKTHIL